MRRTSSAWSWRAGIFARRSKAVATIFSFFRNGVLTCLLVSGFRASGILGNVARNRRALLVASQAVRFRYPIPPFRPYEIRSQLVFADSEWMYFLHKFQCPTTGKLYAEGLCRASCREKGGNVSAAKLYAEVFGGGAEALRTLPQEMPDVVRELLEWDSADKLELETPAEATRRQVETAMPSAQLASGNLLRRALARVTRSWNLPR
jgi:hypothetical protein